MNESDIAIRKLARLARDGGRLDLAAEAESLAERTREGRFYVACVGQFKRGKSTLLNALVGRRVLPTGVVPVTSAVTILRYGESVSARVRLVSGEEREADADELVRYVSETENPENVKGVAAVEVFLPSPLLASGMCLVDTPGIGSVFHGNSAVTRGFVPHIDAALVVLGADPPLSGEELALLADIGRHARDLIFVLNKADRLTDEERRQAAAFTRQVIAKRLGRLPGPLFEVSAAERMAGQVSRDWLAMEEALGKLAEHSGAELVRAAQRRGIDFLAQRIARDLGEQRGALTRPLEESERRVARLKRCLADAEVALRDLGYRLTAEQERLAKMFDARRTAFVAAALPEAHRQLAAGIAAATERGPRLRRRAVTLAQELSRQWIEPKLREEERTAEELYRDSMRRFVRMANEFLKRLADSTPELDGLPRAVEESGLATRSRFFLHELLTIVPITIWTGIADSLRARRRAAQAVERAARAYLDRMLETNAARINNDLRERVLESRRRLEAEIRGRLREASDSAERALEQARVRRAQGAEAVASEVGRLDALYAETEALRSETAS